MAAVKTGALAPGPDHQQEKQFQIEICHHVTFLIKGRLMIIS
jgi:hypothetical protein